MPSLAPPPLAQVANPMPYSQPNLPGSFWSASGPALHPEFPSSQNPTGNLIRAQPPTLSGVAYGRQAITRDTQFAKPTGLPAGPSAVSSHIGPSLSNISLADKASQTSDPLFSALRDATSLYNLSHESLEKLVGDVVREDGFIGLVCITSCFQSISYITLRRWSISQQCGKLKGIHKYIEVIITLFKIEYMVKKLWPC